MTGHGNLPPSMRYCASVLHLGGMAISAFGDSPGNRHPGLLYRFWLGEVATQRPFAIGPSAVAGRFSIAAKSFSRTFAGETVG